MTVNGSILNVSKPRAPTTKSTSKNVNWMENLAEQAMNDYKDKVKKLKQEGFENWEIEQAHLFFERNGKVCSFEDYKKYINRSVNLKREEVKKVIASPVMRGRPRVRGGKAQCDP